MSAIGMRILKIIGLITGAILFMLIGGTLLSVAEKKAAIVVAAVGLIGSVAMRIQKLYLISVFFFYLILAAGFSIWLGEN